MYGFVVADCGVEVVGLSIPRLRPPSKEGGKFEELSIARQNGRRQLEDAQSTVNTNMSLIVGDVARADEVARGIGELIKLEQESKAGMDLVAQAKARTAADGLRARLEQILLDSRAQTASVISNARALRWTALMDAQSIAQDVLGQSPAWKVAPELYRTRRTMEALSESLAGVRVKYVLLPDAKSQVTLRYEESKPVAATTPGGRPASRHSLATTRAVSGVCSAGLSTTLLPQARAGTIAQGAAEGPFQGEITATTPTGSFSASMRRPVSTSSAFSSKSGKVPSLKMACAQKTVSPGSTC